MKEKVTPLKRPEMTTDEVRAQVVRADSNEGVFARFYGSRAFWQLVREKRVKAGYTQVRAMYSGMMDTVFEVKENNQLVILNPFRDRSPKDPTLALSLDECPDGWEVINLVPLSVYQSASTK
jgi:hypothetical protein